MKIDCEIVAVSDAEHLQQIYTGFNLLHRRGFLNLRQTIPPELLKNKNAPDRWVNYKFFNVKVVINGKTTVCYDTHDWNWIDEDVLRETDFYFKRSYDARYLSQLKEKDKVFPLGFNYEVTSPGKDLFRLERAAFYETKDKIKTIAKGLRIDKFLPGKGDCSRLVRLESYPDFTGEPKILFMARAWNPRALPDKQQKETVQALNENRAASIRILRKEFGENFFGGLAHDDYSSSNFKDCLLPGENLSNKGKYLEILKNFPICVATSGLNKSNGWKLAEYVAFSKAIITEPLHFQVTGDFAKEANYLEFTTPEELVEGATRLFEDKHRRFEMMVNNYRYYQSFVRPDSLILNTLAVVFSRR